MGRRRADAIDLACREWAQVRRRQDLYGFIASRVAKIAEHEHVDAVRKAGIRILVHGWRKNAAGRWTLREVDCS